MSTLNIGGDKNDKSYRYKMPVLKTKIEGRGNGIKTVIPNMVDIAKSLHVDPAYPTKFFGLELGAQSKFDTKRQEAIVNGNHDASHLAKLLEKFIEGFILCPNCGLPELTMDIRKSAVKINCAACGHHSELSPAHRLVTFILKNPTDRKGGKEEGKDKDVKKKPSKSRETSNGSKNSGSDEEGTPKHQHGEDADDADPADGTASAGRSTSPVKKQNGAKNGSKNSGAASKAAETSSEAPPEEVEFLTDTSKEAALKRRQQELEDMKVAAPAASEASALNSTDTPVDVMRAAIARHSEDVAMVTSELRRLQLARGLDDVQKAALLLESLIDPTAPKTAPNLLKQHSKVLANFAKDDKSRQLLIDGFEQLVGVTYPKLLAATARMLQTLYETDVLPEETILAWHESPAEASKLPNKQVAQDIRLKADKLVEWLKNAEEESEED